MRLVLIPMILLASVMASANLETPEQAKELPTCTFESKEVGKLKFRGDSREVAFENTARACLKARMAYYVVQRGSIPTQERQILWAEDCANNTYCKR